MSVTGPVIRTPGDVADLRTWLADQWKPGHLYERWLKKRHADEAKTIDGVETKHQVGVIPSWVHATWEGMAITRASLWWVGTEMVDLLLACASAIPDDLSFVDLPPFPDSGLIVFQKPWQGLDAQSDDTRTIPVHALVWYKAVITGGLETMCISSYQYVDFDGGLTGPELSRAVEVGMVYEARAVDLRSEGGEWASLHGRAWMPLGKSDWPIHDDLGDRPGWMEGPDSLWKSGREDRAVLAAFWHLIHQQGVTRTEEVSPPRHARRRAVRAGIKSETNVRVITLRESAHAPHDGVEAPPADTVGKREWSHRWLVGFPQGFWRWQHHGKLNKERKLIWIAPYVKGPADKPLSTKPTVNAWVR